MDSILCFLLREIDKVFFYQLIVNRRLQNASLISPEINIDPQLLKTQKLVNVLCSCVL